MDWIVVALHQSYADEKRFREDAITRLQEEKRPPEPIPATFFKSWLPTVHNLRNFLLTATTEVRSFFQRRAVP